MSSKYDIKTFKPRVGDIQQGYFRPENPDKYIGEALPIIYRSSWELKFMMFCDVNPHVKEYASEPVGIPYYHPIDKNVHQYFVDFFVLIEKDGVKQKWFIEVKPKKFLFMPKKPKRETTKGLERYVRDVKNYIINQAKFEAARNFAKSKNGQFGIITENFIFKKMV